MGWAGYITCYYGYSLVGYSLVKEHRSGWWLATCRTCYYDGCELGLLRGDEGMLGMCTCTYLHMYRNIIV